MCCKAPGGTKGFLCGFCYLAGSAMTKSPKTAVSFYFLFSLKLHLFMYNTACKQKKKQPHLIRPCMGLLCKMFLTACSTWLEAVKAQLSHSLVRPQSSHANHKKHVQKDPLQLGYVCPLLFFLYIVTSVDFIFFSYSSCSEEHSSEIVN